MPAISTPGIERKATPHTAVLLPGYRDKTDLKSGLIHAEDVLADAYYNGPTLDNLGVTCRAHMRIGAELPFYEVAYRGNVYRLLARPVAKQSAGFRDAEVKYELVRTWAPGLRVDGWFLSPPAGVPNTPRSLIEELQTTIAVDFGTREDFLVGAYSIFHYRLDNQGRYPQSLQPPGYTLREILLASVNGEGALSTLYETPKSTNVELWTMFLRQLEFKDRSQLVDYANSGMAVQEFGAVGAAAIREALTLREGNAISTRPMNGQRFLEAFPPSKLSNEFSRDVGRSADFL
ncbi:hypothetical protein BLA18110_07747 [Burkholderia lata]|uniref:hypothetical protein n=1 Tax=Burkholderia lata (strain ATCC 17760 / DSM 23089 / LMG 22485 / NCIMB 9086 / R18194 / 383) TaxID=482957 RepID=UPI0014537BEC|nr:hypothetical protein [Burkholderia lata]VWD52204.1 hypothetical protein BLA18110_07747 [Burkholderia lata]